MELVSDKPILVTGATGFVASHIVEQLLEKGYKVRGTVRKIGSDKNQHLLEMKGANENLQLVELDLFGEDEKFLEVVNGCEYVIHTASPYSMNVKDPQRDLVDPALMGTEKMMRAALNGHVKKVVLTSSVAAVTDEPLEGHIYTEKDWNMLSSLNRNPYYYSKTVAERAAWKFVEDLPEDQKFQLIVINPYMVVGPSHSKLQGVNDSVSAIHRCLTNETPGIVDLCWSMVDVRDVARAHIYAMEKPNANGRYLVVNPEGIMKMRNAIEMLKKNFPDYELPALPLDGFLGSTMVRMFSFFQPGQLGQYLRCSLGHSFACDVSKGKEELGVTYIDIEKTMVDTANSLIDLGFVADKRTSK